MSDSRIMVTKTSTRVNPFTIFDLRFTIEQQRKPATLKFRRGTWNLELGTWNFIFMVHSQKIAVERNTRHSGKEARRRCFERAVHSPTCGMSGGRCLCCHWAATARET